MIPIGTILHPYAASLNLISCSYRNFDKTSLWQGTTPEAVKTSQKYESDDTTSFLVQSGKRLHSFKRLKVDRTNCGSFILRSHSISTPTIITHLNKKYCLS